MSLEAKSKEKDEGKVAAGTVGISAVSRHRDEYRCQHALVVGRAFPTSKGRASALAKEIDDDRRKTEALGEPKTITLITIDDLAELVRLRPIKQVGLQKLRELFRKCRLSQESKEWVDSVRRIKIKKPPYKKIVLAIEAQQKNFSMAPVKYAALRVALASLNPPIKYETDDELMGL